MEKVFKNKKLAYVLIGILCALQLTQSIANWCGGGFNGGSLVLCILMLGLLILVGVGIAKGNRLLTLISGVSILSVVIYALISEYSGLIVKAINEKMPAGLVTQGIMSSLCTLLLIGTLVLAILKAFGINKNLKTINNVFCLVAVLFALVGLIIGLTLIPDVQVSTTRLIYAKCRDIMIIFFPLLVACVTYHLEFKE